MRSPEHRKYDHREAQNYDNDATTRYRTPGAFTVLPTDDDLLQNPPTAPAPYRLTPSTRRHKNLSFAILAEPTSAPASRSPSPTGRVSPFRGRGFNPIGSRHVSPIPSPPPPQGAVETSNISKIPKLTRRGSASAFGEKITDFQVSPNRRKLNAQLSQSLNNIAPKKIVSTRPPPSPRKPQAFQRLSPIIGSSPEPSQSQSSPKVVNLQSTKLKSPVRSQSFVHRPPKNIARPGSRANSRSTSREPSPSKNPTSPTRIPIKNNYKNVQAKVNSFSKTPKPKVPPKPQVLREETTEDSSDNMLSTNISTTGRKRIERKESFNKAGINSNAGSKINNNSNNTKNVTNNNNTNKNKSNSNSSKTIDNISNNNNGDTSKPTGNIKRRNSTVNTNIKNSTKKSSTENLTNKQKSPTKKPPPVNGNTEKDSTKKEAPVKLSDLLQPSTTTVVSSTTSTVTQPLKIEAKLDLKQEKVSPMVDGRVLSATSVSQAMNKMNDTALQSQALMKESGLTKLSPAANAIIAMSRESTNPALDTKNATTALPSVEKISEKSAKESATNHITNTGHLPSAKMLDQHVQNNMSKLISPEPIGNLVQKSVNDRIIEARTVVARDVKPIQITVKEKPMDAEVQSGNIRFDTSNGISERPSLPPPQPPLNEPQSQAQEAPKGNVCTRLLTSCKKKLSCNRSKSQKGNDQKQNVPKTTPESSSNRSCFSCKKKQQPNVTINIEDEEPKKSCWDKVCCGGNKVGDTTSCFSTGKRKSNWNDRRNSILSSTTTDKSKNCCSMFWRKAFCLNQCRKKKAIEEEHISRRASMLSKKKSLTPDVQVEDHTPKIDISLVEHTSQMKAAIPILPVGLAWFCLVMNCIGPGTGTVFSGLFCLCIGIPRFSQKDGPRPRIGAFIIDLIIGFSQFFTVLFCLVGWGWSIWWGVIMVKIAKKHRKIKALEAQEEEASRPSPATNQNHRDAERGS